MNKKYYFVLALFLFLLIVTPSMGQTFYFTGNETINVGDVTVLSLYVNTSVVLGSIQLEIHFDPTILRAEGVTFAASNGIFEKTIDNSTGKITIGAISISGIGSGKLADIFFMGINAGYSLLNISIIDLTDTNNNYLQGHSINTSILVLATNQPPNASQQILYFNLSEGMQLIYVWNNTLHHPDPIIENVTLTEISVAPWGTVDYFFDFDNSGGAFGHYAIALDNGSIHLRTRHWSVPGGFIPLPMYASFNYYVPPSMIFPTNTSVGYSWTGRTTLHGYSANYTSFIEGFENVTTPAGTFYCAKVVTYIESTHSYINGTRTMWIGEPGLVKLIYNHGDGSTTYVELSDVTQIALPLDSREVSISPGDGFVDVTLTWSGDGQIRLDLINFTALDTVDISGSGTQTFTLTLPPDSPSGYYFIHVVDSSGYFHFGDRVYIESAGYTISIPQITLQLNKTAVIPVTIFASANITAVNFTLRYDSSIVQILNVGAVLPSQIYTNIDNVNGLAKFAIVFNNSISGEANILNLTVGAVSTGYTLLEITGAEVSGEDFNVTSVNTFNGSVTVILAQRGDLNRDNRIDIADVTMVAYMVVGKIEPDLAADFNGNGRVDIGDLAKIAYYVLGKISEL